MSTAGGTVRLPNLYIIGAAKCGTSSLRQYLLQHPDVFVTRYKEPRYFPEEYENGTDWYLEHYYGDWGGERYACESGSKMFPRFVAARVAETVPDARLVAALREPVERAFSHWWMNYSRGKEPLTFADAIDENFRSRDARGDADVPPEAWRNYRTAYASGRVSDRYYIEFGEYRRALGAFVEHYPAERLLVLFTEELKREPELAFGRLLGFLGLGHDVSRGWDLQAANQAQAVRQSPALHALRRVAGALPFRVPGRRAAFGIAQRLLRRRVEIPPMDEAVAERLRCHYAAENQGLHELIGRDDAPAWVRPEIPVDGRGHVDTG